MSETASYATDTQDGFSVSSNTETEDAIRENLSSSPKPKDGEAAPEKDPVSKAAAELGSLGGKATAAKRSEAKPEDATAPEVKEPKDPEAKPESKPIGKPRDDPRARMLEATRKESEAKKALAAERAERQALADEVREIRSALTKREPGDSQDRGDAQRKPAGDGKPTPDQFDDYEQYLDARDGWNRKQWEKENAHREAESTYQKRVVGHVEEFTKAITKAAQSDPEFQANVAQEVMDLQPTLTLDPRQMPNASNWIADELVFSSENAPALMLHLSEHPDELQRIATLSSPRAVTREMAKLAARLEAASAGVSSKPEPSKAKPPVRPVTGSPHAADPTEVSEETPFEEHVKRMNARDRSAQRR